MRARRPEVSFKREDWVRVARGPYKDDLAQIVDVYPGRAECRLKLVPRLADPRSGAKRGRNSSRNRPRQALFDPDAYR